MSFSQLIDDLDSLRKRRATENRKIILPSSRQVGRPAILKALKDSVASYTRPKHRASPTPETQGDAAKKLSSKLDDLISRAARAFANKEITAQQLSEFEIHWNSALSKLRSEGKL